MIDCREALARLYDYLDRELTPERAEEVAEHLRHCRHCFDRAEFERNFGNFVRESGKEQVDAAPLRKKIKAKLKEFEVGAELDREELFPDHSDVAPIDATPVSSPHLTDEELERMRTYYRTRPASEPGSGPGASIRHADESLRRRTPFWAYLLAAAAVVLIAIPIVRQFGSGGGTDPVVRVLVAMHTDQEPMIANSDPQVLADWIGARTSFDPMVREFAQVGCGVKGATVDSVWGTQLSHLYAERRGTPLSVFVTAADKFVMPGGLGVVQEGDYRFWTTRDGDYSLVIWKSEVPGIVCIAIARLDMMEIVGLMHQAEEIMEEGHA